MYQATIKIDHIADEATVTPAPADAAAGRKLRTLGCTEIRPGTFAATRVQLRKFMTWHFGPEPKPRTPAQKRANTANLVKAQAARLAKATEERSNLLSATSKADSGGQAE